MPCCTSRSGKSPRMRLLSTTSASSTSQRPCAGGRSQNRHLLGLPCSHYTAVRSGCDLSAMVAARTQRRSLRQAGVKPHADLIGPQAGLLLPQLVTQGHSR
jgi:hypothetical protein